ncbi:MAG TPA: methylmalonyl Co-A mutase-associated GTPase MeaB [Pirellulales bacterium]|jgi:LAO/AO transport system kinase
MTLRANLIERFLQHDRRALAELLTLVELGQAPALPAVSRSNGPARVIGLTGSGGAGKSTLVGALITHLRGQGVTVAVLACDPQSPVTGGALLGDRIRVRFDPADEGVYFRSLSTRGAAGGVSAATSAARDWLTAFGFDVILIETVGVGQDQIAVRSSVETLVLLVTPNTGDEVQWEKAGLIEVADLLVVNKSDLPGADRVRQQLQSALSLSPRSQRVPVLNITAATGQGVSELWDAIVADSIRKTNT